MDEVEGSKTQNNINWIQALFVTFKGDLIVTRAYPEIVIKIIERRILNKTYNIVLIIPFKERN